MPRAKSLKVATCILLLAALAGCTEEVPFAEVSSEAVQALTEESPKAETGQSVTRLSDGRWLLLGGGAGEKPSAAAELQREGAASEPLAQGLAHA
ncbi:hypothetical protein, partial [Myxococcus sp. RHSTA-1-4]|uniref:hypothetical protein n=1 Tax=Myxococcus sp. RHSTA-1-4 TaxID=2874601 RepID=UPI001CC09576